MLPMEIKKFEVFTTSHYDGYICDNRFLPDVTQLRCIIDQLLAGLEQLIRAGKCHNDLKPTNILYKYSNNKYTIKIGDFGQCGTQGGTPGWTAPVFLKNRKPGKEDMYSIGLVILRLLCAHSMARLNFSQLVCPDQDLFHCLRDNFVDNIDIAAQWMVDFKNMTEIKFVTSMINLENQPTFHEVEKEWNRIRYSIKTIDVPFLLQSQRPVPCQYLKPQYTHKK